MRTPISRQPETFCASVAQGNPAPVSSNRLKTYLASAPTTPPAETAPNTHARHIIGVAAPDISASGRHCVALKLTSSTWRMASPPSASYPTTTVIDETSSGTATDVERCVYTHSATPGNVSICSPPSKRTPRRTVSTTSEVRTQADRPSGGPGATPT